MFKIEEVTVVGSCVVSFLGTSDDELSEGGTVLVFSCLRSMWQEPALLLQVLHYSLSTSTF